MEKLAITVEEMAQQIGICRVKAYALARSEGFPTVRIGKRMLIPVDQFKEWLSERAGKVS